ncbi:MAG TPA: GGDEF domain-containing protein, partial [Cellvibrio sp.]
YLGEIIFSRSKRFAEAELITLEFLLSSLIYPLRNAIRYQTAMRLALLDPLTLLGNRAALDTALRRELQMAERHQHELSLLMVDVDFFKKINDEYGHHRGDLVLCEIAKGIQSACRGSDITFRYGGEEFVVVLGKTDAERAKIIAERIRQQIAESHIKYNGKTIGTTVSIGIATRHSNEKEHINDLFERADKALYIAKNSGRNCVISSDEILIKS